MSRSKPARYRGELILVLDDIKFHVFLKNVANEDDVIGYYMDGDSFQIVHRYANHECWDKIRKEVKKIQRGRSSIPEIPAHKGWERKAKPDDPVPQFKDDDPFVVADDPEDSFWTKDRFERMAVKEAGRNMKVIPENATMSHRRQPTIDYGRDELETRF